MGTLRARRILILTVGVLVASTLGACFVPPGGGPGTTTTTTTTAAPTCDVEANDTSGTASNAGALGTVYSSCNSHAPSGDTDWFKLSSGSQSPLKNLRLACVQDFGPLPTMSLFYDDGAGLLPAASEGCTTVGLGEKAGRSWYLQLAHPASTGARATFSVTEVDAP